MNKLSSKDGDNWVSQSYPAAFCLQPLQGGTTRLAIGVPAGDRLVFSRLLACMHEPLYLLYVLHTPRGEGPPGRYQSPELSQSDVLDFVKRFSLLLGTDARHDIWAHSPEDNATLVWERHNIIYAYGLLDRFESVLTQLGFSRENIDIDFPHQHHYRAENDDDARVVLSYFDWSYTPLRAEDEQ